MRRSRREVPSLVVHRSIRFGCDWRRARGSAALGNANNRVKRSAKLVFGLAIALLVVAAAEAAARVYSAVRFHNAYAFGYGREFLSRIRAGTATVEDARVMSDAARLGTDVEVRFQQRHLPSPPLSPRPARTVIVNGIEAHLNSLGFRGAEPGGIGRP